MSAPPGVVDVRSDRLRDFLVASLVMLGLGFAWVALQRFNARIDAPPPVAASPAPTPCPTGAIKLGPGRELSCAPNLNGGWGHAPKPRGRCYLGPSRVRELPAKPTSGEALALCAREPHGCVFDSIGTAYALEEPFMIHCVAPGDGRK